jgi:hypothetical protein
LPSSNDLFDGWDLERDLPTTAADVEALRRHRPRGSLEDLARLSALADPEALRRRPTFSPDLPDFEL